MIEPSNDERSQWPSATEDYVLALEERVAELEARDAILRSAVEWFEQRRPLLAPNTLPIWYVDAKPL